MATKKTKQKKEEKFDPIMDFCRVMGICRISISDGEILTDMTSNLDLKFNKLKEINILTNQKIKDQMFVYYKKEPYVTIAKELYDTAKKIFKAFYHTTKFKMACAEKDHPILLYYDSMGIIIAPRVEDKDIFDEEVDDE